MINTDSNDEHSWELVAQFPWCPCQPIRSLSVRLHPSAVNKMFVINYKETLSNIYHAKIGQKGQTV